MRRLVGALCALIMGVTVLTASPAQADPFFSDYGHWNCPNGITVNLGGGSGWKHHMRRAIWSWNNEVAPYYLNAPRVTKINDVGWDGVVHYLPCTVDVDEVWDGPNSAQAGLAKWPDKPHVEGGAVIMQSETWFRTNAWEHDYIAIHEFFHTMGLGHNPYCDSVMHPTCYQKIALNLRDTDTLRRMYSHFH